MIETLRIADLAIVDEVELEFGPGLNVLTGETGAGKSIVLGALSLLAGGRASADAVRDGTERAEVEAVLRADIAAGRGVDVTGTPTFFVDGRRVMTRSFESFRSLIDERLDSRSGGS